MGSDHATFLANLFSLFYEGNMQILKRKKMLCQPKSFVIHSHLQMIQLPSIMRIFKNITRIFIQLSWNSKKESQVNKKDNFLDLNINMQNSRFKQNFMINEAISILSKSGYHENQVVFHIRFFTQQCLKKYSVRIFL